MLAEHIYPALWLYANQLFTFFVSCDKAVHDPVAKVPVDLKMQGVTTFPEGDAKFCCKDSANSCNCTASRHGLATIFLCDAPSDCT